jgi:ribosomal protein S6
MEYELMFLIEEGKKPQLEEIKKSVHQLVEEVGGTWIGESVEFEQKMAYRINHQWRGLYFVQRFTLPTAEELADKNEENNNANAEITRQMNLQKDILRYIVVKAKDLPPLEDFVQVINKTKKESKAVLKEKGEKIDSKLEEALNI